MTEAGELPPNVARWAAIVRRCVVGTQVAREPLALDDDELAPLLGDVAGDDLALLRGAGVLGLLHRAAARAPRVVAPPATGAGVEEETRPRCSPDAAADLALALASGDRELALEWIALADRAGLRVSEELLPRVLDFGAAQREHRAAIARIAGVRGRLLAGAEPAWSYLAGDEPFESVWKHGEIAVRALALTAERERDPRRAREILAGSWKSENANARAQLLSALGTRLDDEDEPLLEAALDDRSMPVRATALKLLLMLPESRLVRRSRERVVPLVGVERALLRRRLRVALPEALTPEMRRDLIIEKPVAAIGPRAFWLQQMLGYVPPSTWSDAFGLQPADLLALAREHDDAHALLGGWAQATITFRDDAWSVAFLDAATPGEHLGHARTANFGMPGSAPRAAAMRRLLERRDPGLASMYACYAAPWPEALSRTALGLARWIAEQKTFEWRAAFANLTNVLATAIDPRLPEALSIWPEHFDFEADARAAVKFCRTVAQRARLWNHLSRKDA